MHRWCRSISPSDIDDADTETTYLISMIPISLSGIDDIATDTWPLRYRYRCLRPMRQHRYLISMVPISLSAIDDTDTAICYGRYRYLLSNMPVPDIDGTDTDTRYRYRCLISMIPICITLSDIDDTDTDTWYPWYRYRWLISMRSMPIPDIDSAI